MRLRRHVAEISLALALAAALIIPATAQGPVQLTPPAPPAAPTPPAPKPAAKPAPRRPAPAATQAAPAVPPAPAAPATTTAAPPPALRNEPASAPDLAYGAYQRGQYMTAFAIATRRVEEKKDARAMTLLGELYANGFGVEHDDKKAADWYQLAADRGDREAMFALAMFNLRGRIGNVNREQAARLLAAAAKLGQI